MTSAQGGSACHSLFIRSLRISNSSHCTCKGNVLFYVREMRPSMQVCTCLAKLADTLLLQVLDVLIW